MPRLDAGDTVALDDPIAAARFVAEEVEFWRDAGIYYFVPCVFEGARLPSWRSVARRPTSRSTARTSRLLTAVAGQVATAIENGRLYRAAASQGRRARPDARVQREHPRVARRRAGRVRRGRADRPLEPRARGLLRRRARRRRSAGTLGDVFDAPFVDALRGRASEHPYGATLYRVPLTCVTPGAEPADAGRSSLVNATASAAAESGGRRRRSSSARSCCSRTSPIACGSRSSCRSPEKMASIGLLGGRRRARGQHAADRHLELHADAARGRRPRRSDRQRCSRRSSGRRSGAAKIVNGLLNLSRPGPPANERIDVDLNAVDHRRVLAARAPVRGRQHQGAARAGAGAGRWCSASSISCSRCSSTCS